MKKIYPILSLYFFIFIVFFLYNETIVYGETKETIASEQPKAIETSYQNPHLSGNAMLATKPDQALTFGQTPFAEQAMAPLLAEQLNTFLQTSRTVQTGLFFEANPQTNTLNIVFKYQGRETGRYTLTKNSDGTYQMGSVNLVNKTRIAAQGRTLTLDLYRNSRTQQTGCMVLIQGSNTPTRLFGNFRATEGNRGFVASELHRSESALRTFFTQHAQIKTISDMLSYTTSADYISLFTAHIAPLQESLSATQLQEVSSYLQKLISDRSFVCQELNVDAARYREIQHGLMPEEELQQYRVALLLAKIHSFSDPGYVIQEDRALSTEEQSAYAHLATFRTDHPEFSLSKQKERELIHDLVAIISASHEQLQHLLLEKLHTSSSQEQDKINTFLRQLWKTDTRQEAKEYLMTEQCKKYAHNPE